MTIEYVTIGEVTIDDTVLENGEVMRTQTGGGTVYSALGARLWGHGVGINSVVGHEYPPENLAILEAHGISTAGIRRIDGWSLRLWLLHEENNKKQQFPKLQSSSFQQLDEARLDPPDSYMQAKAFHLAPATPEGQVRSRDSVRGTRSDTLISLDILTEPFVNFDAYRKSSTYRGVDIFSPSIVEIEALWPGRSVDDALGIIAGFGVHWIAIKMDTRGSIIHDARQGKTYCIPIYPTRAVDPTGAGDAFSGGFMEGIAETGDVLEAGLRGTISASFAVEGWGAFGLLEISKEKAEERLAWLRNRVAA